MSHNESDMSELLGKAMKDAQEEGIAAAGKNLLGGFLGNALGGFLGGGNVEEETTRGDEEESEETEETGEAEETETSDEDEPVINNAGGDYSRTQVAAGRDHDVDDDIDGDDDDTSEQDNLA